MTKESTGFSDKHRREIFLGDVVRAQIKKPFQEMHGAWAEYEITKAAGGYVLSYFRSEKGCMMPFGYTAQFMNQFGFDDDDEELPDLKVLLWSEDPVVHSSLELIPTCDVAPADRRELFMIESRQRMEARKNAD